MKLNLEFADGDIAAIAEHASKELTENPEFASLNFCSIWPQAKSMLQLLAGFLPFPASTAINIVINIGDGVYASTCK
ncbi:hypothetical protein [Martelella endophytica]|uniref:Uncharacterized protein n=1 Tax=Martelella endophytica TaxID=1486262 RepID=A0A0D5LMX8_MAREN|nr:hypothetical protein [Martelella endophytica]AJY45310.1 hypothetical protein TM49_05740 [Martelella endophytica]